MKRSLKMVLCICVALLCIVGLFLGSRALPVMQAEKHGVPSSTLEKVKSKDGDTQRTDYVDSNGVLTYASDKGYATIISTTSGNTVRDVYLDEQGKPAVQAHGHYGLLKEHNDHGQVHRVTYLDVQGNPIVVDKGYATYERTYDEFGRLHMERYYDANGKPAKSRGSGYGFINGYDVDGNEAAVLYLNEDGGLGEAVDGYAMQTRTFIKSDDARDGLVEYEFYWDVHGDSARRIAGYSGIYKEYDEQGNNTLVTYLGSDGKPVMTTNGYATVRKTYENGTLQTDTFFDTQGNPVALVDGQYGVRHVGGDLIYLDIKGNEYFSLKNQLFKQPLLVIVAALLIVIASLVLPRRASIILLVLYVVFIASMTLGYRASTVRRANLELFWSYKQLSSNVTLRHEVMFNILLFVPFGAILYRLRKHAKVLLVAVAVSVGIEVVQYFMGIGLCELDDVVSNCLGAGMGMLIAYIWSEFVAKRDIPSRLALKFFR